MRHNVEIQACPSCGGELAIIELVEHVTPAGQRLGSDFVKCRSGCTKRQILFGGRKFQPRQPLPDDFFLSVLAEARALGKRITAADKDREVVIRFGGRTA